MSKANLFLVRHGRPLDKERDPRRGLAPEGRDQAHKIGRWLAEQLGSNTLAIYHSGKDRARQTAEIIAGEIAGKVAEVTVEVRDGLNPKDDVLPIVEWLANSDRPIMIVGHLPFLAYLLQQLVGLAAEERGFEECRTIGLIRDNNKFELKFIQDPTDL